MFLVRRWASESFTKRSGTHKRPKQEAALPIDKANEVCAELSEIKTGKIKVKIRADGQKLSRGEERASCYLSGKDEKHHKRLRGSTVKLVAKERILTVQPLCCCTDRCIAAMQ